MGGKKMNARRGVGQGGDGKCERAGNEKGEEVEELWADEDI